MKNILNNLFEYKTLSKEEAKSILHGITDSSYNEYQVTSFLTVYMMRPITVEELQGFREALLERSLTVDFGSAETIDLCGTGGDNKDTFNISTLASFVVAGAGIKVAKHSNVGVSSLSGSSNVMECLGYVFTNDASRLQEQMDKVGICLLHAPLFHPAMAAVTPIRKALKVRTFFNMLGPLVNPAQPTHQLTGVYSMELMRKYNYLLQLTNSIYKLLHTTDGYDEVSLTANFKTVSRNAEKQYSPSMLGFEPISPKELSGGNSIDEAAQIFLNILNRKGTQSQNNVVIANAALAIQLAKPKYSLEEALAIARESLESGKAKRIFRSLIKLSKNQ